MPFRVWRCAVVGLVGAFSLTAGHALTGCGGAATSAPDAVDTAADSEPGDGFEDVAADPDGGDTTAPAPDGVGDAADSADGAAADTAMDDTADTPDADAEAADADAADAAGDDTVADTASAEDTASALDTVPPSDTGPPPECDGADDCPAPAAPCQVAACVAGRCAATVAPDAAPCSDDNVCTTDDRCLGGGCVGGPARACDDDEPCTADGCNRLTGCVTFPLAGPCDDGDACTAGDSCVAGACQPGPALACDDANPCTSDACDPALGCTHAATDGPCDDADACTDGDQCQQGACAPGPPLACPEDADPCADAACDPRYGCVALFNQAPCDDGDACSDGDACVGGACVGGAERVCADAEPCTLDGCNPAVGCSFEPRAGSCDDGSQCTIGDSCQDGACVGGGPRDCGAAGPCRDVGCDPLAGCTSVARTGPCDDGQPCTDGACLDGACAPSPPRLWGWSDPVAGVNYLNDGFATDDGVVLAGYVEVYPTVLDALLVGLDPYGRERFRTVLGRRYVYGAGPASDGYLVAGEGLGPEGRGTDAWIARTDRTGAVVAEYFYGTEDYENAWAVAGLGDGAVFGGAGPGYTLWVVGIDAGGAVLWEHMAPGYGTTYGVTATADGGALALGYADDGGGVAATALRVGSDGAVRWTSRTGGGSDIGWNAAVERPDGHFVVVGYDNANGDYDTVWGELDADGELLWRDRAPFPGVQDYPWRARASADGGVVAAGVAGGDFLALRLDPAGNLALAARYAHDDYSEAYAAIPMPDGGLVLAGQVSVATGAIWAARRVDAWGHSSCDEAGACVDASLATCADGAPCTVDGCDAALGCVHPPLPAGGRCGVDMSCDDDAACLEDP